MSYIVVNNEILTSRIIARVGIEGESPKALIDIVGGAPDVHTSIANEQCIANVSIKNATPIVNVLANNSVLRVTTSLVYGFSLPKSCFSNGVWMNDALWLANEIWKNK